MQKNTARGLICALLATMVWSGNFILSRAVAQEIPPIQLNFWRWLLALICLLPFAWRHLRADWPAMRREWRYLLLMGILGVGLLNPLVYKAGQTTESLNMALLVPTAPMIIMVLSRVLLGGASTARRRGGLLLVLAGVLCVISRGDWARLAAVRFTAGDFWALGGAASFGAYSLFMRHRSGDVSALGFNVATFVLGLLASVPFVVAEMICLPPPTMSPTVWCSIIYAGAGCSTLAYWLWTVAVDDVGPVRAGFVYYTLPLFAAVQSVLLLGEEVLWAHLAGGACIVGGVVTATLPSRFRG